MPLLEPHIRTIGPILTLQTYIHSTLAMTLKHDLNAPVSRGSGQQKYHGGAGVPDEDYRK